MTRPRRAAVILIAVTATTMGALLAPASGALAASPTAGPSRHGAGVDVRKLPTPTPSAGRRAAPQFARDHLLVRFKAGATSSARTASVRAAGAIAIRPTGSLGYSTVATSDVSASLKALKADPSVAYAGYDYIRHATMEPNDPLFQGTSPYNEFNYLNEAGVVGAWNVSIGGTTQVIAVVDSGVDSTAHDLAGKVLAGINETVQPPNSSSGPAPANQACADPAATGHGTFVASVAAADSNNGYGMSGVSWGARLLPVRVLDACGSGFDSNIAAGITWAADHGATVINLSLGGPDPAPVLQTALQYANSKGIPVVVAAGNDGSSTPQYPAAYPEAISVAATDEHGGRASFSSFGDWVDLAAPGWNIIGEEPRALCADASTPNPTDCFFVGAGTSFAAPIVSGIVTLMRTAHPTWTTTQIRSRLEVTTLDKGPAGFDPYYGFGDVDAEAAIGGRRLAYWSGAGGSSAGRNRTEATAEALSQGSTTPLPETAVEGVPLWYSVTTAGTQESISVQPYTAQDPNNPAPAMMEPVVQLFDTTHHLLATAAGDDHGTVTLVSGVPAGTVFFSVTSQNGTALAYYVSVSSTGSAAPPAQGAVSWVHNLAPVPTRAYESEGAPGVPTTVTPTITFNRTMQAASFNTSNVVLRNGVDGSVVTSALTYDGPIRTLTVTPAAALLPGTPYVLTVNAGSAALVQDSTGSSMPELRTSFDTALGSGEPAVTGLVASGTPWGAVLGWDHPVTGGFQQVDVRYALGTTPPTGRASGLEAYTGSLDGVTVTGLSAGHDYAFAVFTEGGDPTGAPVSAAATVVLRGSTTTVTATPTIPVYQAATVVTATVKTLDSLPSAGRAVSFYTRRTGSGTAYTLIGAGTTDVNGQVSITTHPTYNSDHYVVDTGGAGKMGSTALIATPVRYLVSFNAVSTSVPAGSSLHFGGVVTPYRPGSTVTLQQYWGGVWHNMAVSTLNSTSRYGFTVTLAKRSLYEYRVVKAGDTVLSYGITPTITLTAT